MSRATLGTKVFVSFGLLSFVLHAFAESGDSGALERKFGKKLVAEYQIPLDKLEKFASFKASAPVKGESAIVNTLLADSEDWFGPTLNVKSSANPYTIAVMVSGSAKTDGDVATLWQAGWRLDGGESRLTVLPGLAKPSAKAGERLRVTAAAAPTSFKEDRSVAVALALVNARNINIDSVYVAVWSGVADASALELLGSFRWAIVGLILVALWWFWFRRS